MKIVAMQKYLMVLLTLALSPLVIWSQSCDIDPILNLDPCTGSGTIDLNLMLGSNDMVVWQDGTMDLIKVGLGEGTYEVDITTMDCDTTIVFTLDYPDPVEVIIDENTSYLADGCGTVSTSVVSLITTGGTGTYSYSWPGDISMTGSGTGLPPGSYVVTIVDGNNCETTSVFEITEFEEISATVIPESVVDQDCVGSTADNMILGSFEVATVGTNGPYSYSINEGPFGLSPVFSELQAGDYVVEVMDVGGCSTFVEQTIRCIGCKISNNPVQKGENFFVDVFFGDKTETAELSVYNMSGRKVLGPIDLPIVDGELSAFPVVADLDAGTYTVFIKSSELSFSRMLVVVD